MQGQRVLVISVFQHLNDGAGSLPADVFKCTSCMHSCLVFISEMFPGEGALESPSCFMEVESGKVDSDLFSLLTTDYREKPFI